MPDLPSGTVTFLFTDIEGSTRRWEDARAAMASALARHDAVLSAAIEGHGGSVFKTVGDAFCAAFGTAAAAVAAAVAAQQALGAEDWVRFGAELGGLRVRMGVHTGEVEARDGDYFGPAVNRVARLMACGHGGQILVSGIVAGLVADALPAGCALRDLGERRLKDLRRPEPIFQVLGPGLPADFPPLVTLDRVRNNLPVQATSFIGREREIADLCRLLDGARLITVTGLGGGGKTRIGLQVASDLIYGYPDGVWFADLAPLEDPALVAQTLAGAIGLRDEPGRTMLATVTEYLAPRRSLVLLDNCEHVLDAAAQLADALLRSAPNTRVLATSREPLTIAGECIYLLPTLSLPEGEDGDSPDALDRLAQSEAVRLFLDRATAAQPDFTVTRANAPAIADLCRRLDGIPLAIELAAARIRALSVEQIEARLDDRFRLLTGGSRVALPRQRTLRAAIDWSHDLLSPPEQVLFRRLAVFHGWDVEAAERVCAGAGRDPDRPDTSAGPVTIIDEADILDLLAQLVDRSLVVAEERLGQERYRMLETIRAYAGERLDEAGERDALRARHAQHYVERTEGLCQRVEADSGQRDGAEATVDLELDNVRAAVQWSLATGADALGLRLVVALRGAYDVRVRIIEEVRAWLRQLLGQPEGVAPEMLGRAWEISGTLAYSQADYLEGAAAQARARSFFEAAGETREALIAMGYEGWNLACAGGYDRGVSLVEAAVGRWRASGNEVGVPELLIAAGTLYRNLGRIADAEAAYRAAGWDPWLTANLGELAGDAGDFRTGLDYLERAEADARAWHDRFMLSFVLANKGRAAHGVGDLKQARAALREALTLHLETHCTYYLTTVFETLAAIAQTTGDPGRAAVLLGAQESLRARLREPIAPVDQGRHERLVAAVRQAMPARAFDAAWATGAAMTREQAVAYALAECAEGGQSG